MPTESICLLAHTRQLLKNRPRTLTLAQIAEDSGVSLGWLNAFSAGLYSEPSVVRVQKVFERLTGEKLVKIAG